MGFFNKILVQETSTGNLVDITNLDEKHYESFLDAMQKLQAAYIVAKESKSKTRTFRSLSNLSSPKAIEAAVGSLTNLTTSRPAIVPASFVACL